MKALVYTAPKQVEYLDFDDPSPTNGELLVKISIIEKFRLN
jgi:NADPH:quinone reductase-like Zn-dependent oxidoreductase